MVHLRHTVIGLGRRDGRPGNQGRRRRLLHQKKDKLTTKDDALIGQCAHSGARTITQTLLQPRTPASLRRLELPHSHVSDDGVRALVAALKDADSVLTALDLSWNAIGTRGTPARAEQEGPT